MLYWSLLSSNCICRWMVRQFHFYFCFKTLMIKVDAFFISGTLLKEEPCVKFMLKHEIKNYFRQFTKSKSDYV